MPLVFRNFGAKIAKFGCLKLRTRTIGIFERTCNKDMEHLLVYCFLPWQVISRWSQWTSRPRWWEVSRVSVGISATVSWRIVTTRSIVPIKLNKTLKDFSIKCKVCRHHAFNLITAIFLPLAVLKLLNSTRVHQPIPTLE